MARLEDEELRKTLALDMLVFSHEFRVLEKLEIDATDVTSNAILQRKLDKAHKLLLSTVRGCWILLPGRYVDKLRKHGSKPPNLELQPGIVVQEEKHHALSMAERTRTRT